MQPHQAYLNEIRSNDDNSDNPIVHSEAIVPYLAYAASGNRLVQVERSKATASGRIAKWSLLRVLFVGEVRVDEVLQATGIDQNQYKRECSIVALRKYAV